MVSSRQKKIIISSERADSIRSLAEMIAEDFQTPNGTDLNAVMDDSSIELFTDTFPEPFDGLLIKDSQGFRVACNLTTGNNPNSPRGRFTVAHELGHYYIDEHRIALANQMMPSMGERAIEDNMMEREADLFASHLLLPSQFIRKAFKKTGEGLGGIRHLASRFGVSMKCGAIRYVGENLSPCCLTFRDWDGSLKWQWFSRKVWLAGIRKVREDIVAQCATEQVLKQGEGAESSIVELATTARYAFHMGDGPNLNEIFKEEAMALGEYGVLTLLTAKEQDLPLMADILNRRFGREG